MSTDNNKNPSYTPIGDGHCDDRHAPTAADDNSALEEQATLSDSSAWTDAEPVTAHVLFMDIVDSTGYPTDVQPQMLKLLSEIVRETDPYQSALAKDQLLRIPTGDGMALVFFTETPIACVRCAQQVCSALRSKKAQFALRMGIHTGPVYLTEDIDDKPNVSGDGINLANRVMSCGDAGHIMVSNTVADFLGQLKEWSGQLHDLKQVRIKKTKLRPYNLFNDKSGNPKLPKPVRSHRRRQRLNIFGIAVAALLVVFGAIFLLNIKNIRNDPTHSGGKIESVAVLTLTSRNSALADLTRGLTHEIIEGISAISPSDLIIKPDPEYPFQNVQLNPSSDMREAGKLLNAQAVLNGTIELQDNSYAVTFELVDVRTNVPIWPPKTYRVTLQETHHVADLISNEVVKSLRGDASVRESGKNSDRAAQNRAEIDPDAKDFYVDGIALLEKRNKPDIQESIDKLNAAVKKSPNYADAWAALAEAYNISSGYGIGTPKENYEKARTSAKRALDLAPSLPEAHVALGYTLANYDFDWVGAEAEFKQAEELRPNSPSTQYAYAFQYLISMGLMPDAIERMERARDSSPLSIIINTNLGWTYYYAGQYEKARQQYEKALDIDPRSSRAHKRLFELYETTEKYDDAIAEFAILNGDKDADRLRRGLAKSVRDYWTVRIDLLTEEGLRNKESIPKYDLAILYACRGDNETAIKFLREAVEEKTDGIIKIGINPRLRNLRSDPRYVDLVTNRVRVKMWPAAG
jgi:tetratricopeptide (TPR) repeat protein/class 3 adenylate cyclase